MLERTLIVTFQKRAMSEEHQEILDEKVTEVWDELELKNEGLQAEIVSQALGELLRCTQAGRIESSQG